MLEGPGADSEEKHEPASDVDTALVDRLKALDPNRPIREADIRLSERAYSGARALRSGMSEILIRPLNGSFISKIK